MTRHIGEYKWTISLDVQCPYDDCRFVFDANDTPDFFEQIAGVHVCEEKKGVSVTCPDCKREITFDIGGGT